MSELAEFPTTKALARAWADLPAQLQAHPGIKALHRAALAQTSAPSAEPLAWRPNILGQLPQPFTNGEPNQQTIQYWSDLGCGIEYAYSGASPLMANGLTEAETSATASVAGLSLQSGMCSRCGKWAGADATLPGQPRDHLCMCEAPADQKGQP